MFSTGDTIVAIATPPGRGSIGVVRLSGPSARTIGEQLVAHPLEARRAIVGRLDGEHGAAVRDHVVATWFVGPHSYTGEDVVEISTHGNPLILDQVVAASLARGARHAMPGEFTFRAYLNDRIDLVQAEAVADLVEAMTPLQARAAVRSTRWDALAGDPRRRGEAVLDRRPPRGIARLPGRRVPLHRAELVAAELGSVGAELRALLARAEAGRVLREGLRVVIVGRPNVGKSSLFNALVGASRAIVTAHPGTTRDVLAAPFDARGIPCEVVDTAGLHHSENEIEIEGIARAEQAAATADVTLVVVDGSVALEPGDLALVERHRRRCCVVVVNKGDLGVLPGVLARLQGLDGVEVVRASAVSGDGLDDVRTRVAAAAIGGGAASDEVPRVTNRRHAAMLAEAARDVERGSAAARDGASEEFVLSDLHSALAALQSVTGKRAPEELLAEIFSRFCVGK